MNLYHIQIVYIVKAFRKETQMNPDFPQLVNKHGKDLGRLCSSLCSSPYDAEDLYQATWEKAIKNYKKHDPHKPFEKWLWSICINTHKDMLRKPSRKRQAIFESTEELERTLQSIPEKQEDTDAYLSLHNAISKLDEQKRQVIALFYFKDYKLKDLAEILQIPEGTVKSRLNSAREQIRKELNHE